VLQQRRPGTPARLVLVFAFTLLLLAAAAVARAATFSDVEGRSYQQAVELLADAGVIEGCEEGRFCPSRHISRAQIASLLVRALDLPPAEDPALFGDTGSNVHADNIEALAAAGITNGCDEGRFCPDEPITRAELASMLDRAFAPPPTDQDWFDDTHGIHADAIHRLAGAGITAGCGTRLTDFCMRDNVLRWQTAVFLARATDLVPRAQIDSLADRRAEQAAIDAERERREQQERERQRAMAREAERDRIWDDLAQCESGGNWAINTGNGYYGGLQFSLSSWRWVGGSGYPHHHTREEQIYRAEILLSRQGWNAWPACSRKLGYR
jgi:hypothetical protein